MVQQTSLPCSRQDQIPQPITPPQQQSQDGTMCDWQSGYLSGMGTTTPVYQQLDSTPPCTTDITTIGGYLQGGTGGTDCGAASGEGCGGGGVMPQHGEDPCMHAGGGVEGGAAGPGTCAGCGTAIQERYYLQAAGQAWHMGCLTCGDCHLPLQDQPSCYQRDGHILCRNDYYRRYGSSCAGCGMSICASDLVMRARHLVFHLDCFTCCVCQRVLRTGEEFGLRQGRVHCRLHYPGGQDQASPGTCLSPNPLAPTPFYNGTGASHKGRPRKRRRQPQDNDPGIPQLAGMDSDHSLTNDTFCLQSPRQKRMRTSFKHHQLRIMKSYFALNHNPDAKDLKQLAQKTGLSKRVLQVWFQNARAKQRRSSGKSGKGEDGMIQPQSPDGISEEGSICTQDLMSDLPKSPALSDISSGASLSDFQALSGSDHHQPLSDTGHTTSSLTKLLNTMNSIG